MKIRRRMGETKQIVQVNGGNILLFELAFRLLTLPLLLQAVAALFRLSVRASGYSYVTVSNLVSYQIAQNKRPNYLYPITAQQLPASQKSAPKRPLLQHTAKTDKNRRK